MSRRARRKLTTTEARELFAEIVNRAAFAKERVVVTRHGKDLAVLVPMEDLERLEALESRARKTGRTPSEREPSAEARKKARAAVERVREAAAKAGADKLTDKEIDAEVRAVRAQKRR